MNTKRLVALVVGIVLLALGAAFAIHHFVWMSAAHGGAAHGHQAEGQSTAAAPDHQHQQPSAASPSGGQHMPRLTALTSDTVSAYLNGEGMGLAKVAELNHFPGPKHVLEHAAALRLSPEQREQTQKLKDRTIEEAMRLGRLIVHEETQLDDLYVAGRIDGPQLESHISEIAELQGTLRFVHLKAHLEMKAILSQTQIEQYDRLRGYRQDS